MSTEQNTKSTTEEPSLYPPSTQRFGSSSSFSQFGPRSSVIGHRMKSSVLGFSPRICSSILKVCPLSSVLCPLILLALLLTLGPAWAADTPIKERLISIEQKAQTFTQALDAVAEQADISFKTHGDLPQAKRDLTLNQVPLNQAMGHILRLYGVRNHAAAFNPETGTIMLAILETSNNVAALPPDSSNVVSTDKPVFFTIEELSRLTPKTSEDFRTLSPEELEKLESASTDDFRTLTTEELANLKPKSKDDFRTLTTEELANLEPKSKDDFKTLTTEELENLK